MYLLASIELPFTALTRPSPWIGSHQPPKFSVMIGQPMSSDPMNRSGCKGVQARLRKNCRPMPPT